jgi:hypothetical protein
VILSFAWTTVSLIRRLKRVTRRDYADEQMAKWVKLVGKLADAYDKSPRVGGKKVATIRVLDVRREPIRRMLDDPEYARSEWVAEGGDLLWPTVEEFLSTGWGRVNGDPVRIEFEVVSLDGPS